MVAVEDNKPHAQQLQECPPLVSARLCEPELDVAQEGDEEIVLAGELERRQLGHDALALGSQYLVLLRELAALLGDDVCREAVERKIDELPQAALHVGQRGIERCQAILDGVPLAHDPLALLRDGLAQEIWVTQRSGDGFSHDPVKPVGAEAWGRALRVEDAPRVLGSGNSERRSGLPSTSR